MSVRPLIGLAGRAASALARTWAVDVVGEERVHRLREAGVPVVFAVWHGRLLAPLWHRRDEAITLLVSRHGDAAPLADAARRWGYEVVYGSTTRGGVAGLKGIVRTLERGGETALTPDGPRGPAGVVKVGVIAAAQHGGAAIVPVGARASSEWRLRSWDRFAVPRPFARVRIVYGRPIEIACHRAAREPGRTMLAAGLAEAGELACGS